MECFYYQHFHFLLTYRQNTSLLVLLLTMPTPALTTSVLQTASQPYAPHSLQTVAQTTPPQALRSADPPLVLTNSLTCGYMNGIWNSPVTCTSEYSCSYYTTPTSAPNFGCCSGASGCGYVSTCLDYNADNNTNTGGDVAIGPYQFLWYTCSFC